MRNATVRFAAGLLGCILIPPSIVKAAPADAMTEFRSALSAVQAISPCPTFSFANLPAPETLAACDLIGFLRTSAVRLSRVEDAEADDRAASALIEAIGPQTPIAAQNKRLRELSAQISQGDFKAFTRLSVVPEALCKDLVMDVGYCHNPTCLKPPPGTKPLNCPSTPLPFDSTRLKTVVRDWSTKHGYGQCLDVANENRKPSSGADRNKLCLPLDKTALAARTVIETAGAATLTTLINSSSTAVTGNIGSALSRELTCRSDRAEALAISMRVSAPAIGALALPLSSSNLSTLRAFELRPCETPETTALLSAVARHLKDAMAQIMVPAPRKPASPAPTLKTAAPGCSTTDSADHKTFDMLAPDRNFVRGVRIRLLGGNQGSAGQSSRATLALLIDESARPGRIAVPKPLGAVSAEADSAPSACPETLRELDLNTELISLRYVSGTPELADKFGNVTYVADEARIARDLEQLTGLSITQLATVSNIAIDRGVLPLSFNLTLRLPGLNVIVPMGRIKLDLNGKDLGLSALTDKSALITALNSSLKQLKPVVSGVPSLVASSLTDISIVEDDWRRGEIRYNAVIHNRMIAAVVGQGGLATTVRVTSAGALQAEITPLGSNIVDQLKAVSERAIAAYLPQSLLETLKGNDAWIRVASPMLRGNSFRFDVVVSPPGLASDLAFPVELGPDAADVSNQINKQLSGVADQIAKALKDYAEQVLAAEAARLAANAAQGLFNEADIRRALQNGVSLFGTQLSARDINVSNQTLVFTLMCDSPSITIRGVRSSKLDERHIPILDWSHAVLDGSFASWLESQIRPGSYLTIHVTQTFLLSTGQIAMQATAQIPGLTDGLALQINNIDFDRPLSVQMIDIRGQLFSALVSAANKALTNAHFDIGGLVVNVDSFYYTPDNDGSVGLTGRFTFRDLIKGPAQVVLYPGLALKVDARQIVPIAGAFTGYFQLPFADDISVEDITPDPFSVVLKVRLASFLSIGSVYLPEIRLEIPASGDVRISEPIAFPIPIPGGLYIVPPYLVLGKPAVLLYPKKLWKFGATGDLTFVNDTVANLLRIDVRLEGDLRAKVFKLDGPLSVFRSIELAQLKGTVDINNAIVDAQSSTSGPLRELVSADEHMRVDGPRCTMREDVDLALKNLGFSLQGSLAIVLFEASCERSENTCESRGGAPGAICASGNVNLPLGPSAEGKVNLAMNLTAPRVSATVEHVTPFDIGVKVEAGESFAKASFQFLGIHLGLMAILLT